MFCFCFCIWLQGANFSNLPSMERELDSSNSLPSSTSNSAKGISEAERLAAAKNTKELMAKGVNLFNTKGALKGVEFLMSQGLLESSPAAVSDNTRCVGKQLLLWYEEFTSDVSCT